MMKSLSVCAFHWLCVFSLCVLCASLVPSCFAGNWPAWRGPDGTGITTEKGLPVEWSPTKNVKWKAPVPGLGVSTPAVWGDRVFLTACDGRSNERPHVYCFRRSDGRQLWHVRLFGTALSDGQFAPGGMAVSSPVTDGTRLWVLFGTGDLACLDFDGKPLWVRSLAQDYGAFRNRWGMGSSPLLIDGLLVVQVDHWSKSYLIGLDAATGANRWRTEREASVNWTTPVAAHVQGRTQILAAGTYWLRGYDADSGGELWSAKCLEMQCIPSPIVDGDRAYVVSGREHNSVALRLDGARGDRTATHVLWKTKAGPTFTPSPVLYRGRYYYVEDTGRGNCLDAATGKLLWRERMGGNYRASLLAGDGKVYFTNMEGVVTVLEDGPTFKPLAKNDLEEALMASPAVSDGQIFLRGEKHLYCIGH